MHTKKKLLKLIAASIIAGGFTFTPNLYLFTDLPLTMSIAHAEIKTYTGVGESIISDRETLDIGKQGAKLQAIRNAQDQAGIFISSRSEVVNGKLAKDEIIAFTAGIVKISDDVKYEPIPLGDALGTIKYRATVLVTIDTDELEARINQWLSKNAQDRSAITAQNNELNKTVDEIKKTNERIEKQIVNAKTPEDTAKIKEELKALDRDTLYAQKISEGNDLFKSADRDGAIKSYNEAIALYPNDATIAYEKLGDLYFDLKIYDKSIECYDKVIQMDPNYKVPYHKCGVAYYYYTGDTEKAVEYFNKVGLNSANKEEAHIGYLETLRKEILAKPDDASLRFHRAKIYFNDEYYDRALEDIEAIVKLDDELNNRHDEFLIFEDSHFLRGSFYLLLEQYDKTIADFNKYIQNGKIKKYLQFGQNRIFVEFDPNTSEHLFHSKPYNLHDNVYYNLGYCYEKIGNKLKAMEYYKLALKTRKKIENKRTDKFCKKILEEKIEELEGKK